MPDTTNEQDLDWDDPRVDSEEELEQIIADDDGQQWIPGLSHRCLRELRVRHSKGYDHDRIPFRWHERVAYEIWEKYNHVHSNSSESFPHTLLSCKPDFAVLSRQEKALVTKGFSSGIQWLSTNNGYHLLCQIVEAQGFKLHQVDINQLLTSEHIGEREQGLKLKARITKEEAIDKENERLLRKSCPK